jgi:hypothetical protein
MHRFSRSDFGSRNVMFLSAVYSRLRAESFSFRLNVLAGNLGIKKFQKFI